MRTSAISTWLRGGCLAVLIALMPLAVTGSGGVVQKTACGASGTCTIEAGSYCAQDGEIIANWRSVYDDAK